jgi:hypothetical protein
VVLSYENEQDDRSMLRGMDDSIYSHLSFENTDIWIGFFGLDVSTWPFLLKQNNSEF